MMKTTITIFAIFATGFLASCGEDIETLPTDSGAISIKKSGDLVFTLQVLNMDGKPQAIFREGENFFLDFTIENKGKNTVELCDCDLPYATDDFFAVYRVFSDDTGNAEKTLVGKPWDGLGGARDAPITGIRSKEKIEYKVLWSAPKDESFPAPENNISTTIDYFISSEEELLSPGEYTTGFILEDYGVDSDFAVYFTIQ